MRLNKYVAFYTGLSRRRVDQLIRDGKVKVNNLPASLGQNVEEQDIILVNGLPLNQRPNLITIMFNKPEGYVTSRSGQNNPTIYKLLPKELRTLKPVGRLDKDSSGLLLLTNDGELAQRLTHPRYQKEKVYEIELDQPLKKVDYDRITKASVELTDGPSKFKLSYLNDSGSKLKVTMKEGRNRQIRRTFGALGYRVTKLHRIRLGKYNLDNLLTGKWKATV